MGLQKQAPISSRTSNNTKTTTVITDKIPTATLSNDDVKGIIADYSKQKSQIAEQQRQADEKISEEQALADKISKEQEEQKNSITFFKTPSNEDFEKLMKCYERLPHTLKNIDVAKMRPSYEIDLDDDELEELGLDADFEGVTIESKSGDIDKIVISLPMQEDFVKAINTNTETLKEKHNTLRSRYVETDDEGNETIIKPFDKEYEAEYKNIVDEEHEFLFGKESIIKMFEDSVEEVIDKLVKKNPKDKELKNDFKKLKKNLKLEVEYSDPILVVTGIEQDANGIITEVHNESIYTKLKVTLKYPKKSGGDPKEITSLKVNLLDN